MSVDVNFNNNKKKKGKKVSIFGGAYTYTTIKGTKKFENLNLEMYSFKKIVKSIK